MDFLFMFGRDRKHMGGYTVILFYMFIFTDIAISLVHLSPVIESAANLIRLPLAVSYLGCGVGLFLLVMGRKLGGYVAIISALCTVLFGIIALGAEDEEVLINLVVMAVFQICLALKILYGSESRYYLK